MCEYYVAHGNDVFQFEKAELFKKWTGMFKIVAEGNKPDHSHL